MSVCDEIGHNSPFCLFLWVTILLVTSIDGCETPGEISIVLEHMECEDFAEAFNIHRLKHHFCSLMS